VERNGRRRNALLQHAVTGLQLGFFFAQNGLLKRVILGDSLLVLGKVAKGHRLLAMRLGGRKCNIEPAATRLGNMFRSALL
jgi:hypothetical protein